MGIIVYGPKACGKTVNAKLLKRYFGCAYIVDDANWPRAGRELDKFESSSDLLLITTDGVVPKHMVHLEGSLVHRFSSVIGEVLPAEQAGKSTSIEVSHEIKEHPLYPIFIMAIEQAMYGKGERHGGNSTPFLEQPWVHYAKLHGRGFLTGQATKKIEEAANLRSGDDFVTEVLGGLVYAGMAIIDEKKAKL